MRYVLVISAVGMVSGCQLHSSKPSESITVPGDRRAIAECFYTKIKGEGYWKLDHLDATKTSEAILGNIQYTAGTIRFREAGSGSTSVDLLIPHPSKFIPRIQECAGLKMPA